MRVALSLGLLLSFSCGTGPVDNGGHGGHGDHDAGIEPEADAGLADAGSADAGRLDAGVADAGPTDAGVPDAGPVDAGVISVVAAPVLLSISLASHSTYQITWQQQAPGCSSVLLGMKVGAGGSYSTVKTLSGTTTTSQHSPGHSSGTYCYRLTCVLNGVSSSPSNEKCVTQ